MDHHAVGYLSVIYILLINTRVQSIGELILHIHFKCILRIVFKWQYCK
uniref:Uncharacterized protein n=1 Tax=Anguilla anguilla TaxID=7936 RepID=A0A0E9SKU2_ANGAN